MRALIVIALIIAGGVVYLQGFKHIVSNEEGDHTSSKKLNRHTKREEMEDYLRRKSKQDEEVRIKRERAEAEEKNHHVDLASTTAGDSSEEIQFRCNSHFPPTTSSSSMMKTQSTMSKYLPTDFGKCDFDLAKDLEYLPSRRYLAAISKSPPATWQSDYEYLTTYIERLQEPKNCDQPDSEDHNRWHLVKLIQAGIGFNIYLFTDVVGRHWESGVSVMVNKNNLWRFTDYKCGRGTTCHLKELTQCDINKIDLKQLVAITHHGPPWPTLDDICTENGQYIVDKGRCLCNKGYLPHESGVGDPACMKPQSDRDRIPGKDEALDGNIPWSLAAPGEVDTGGSGCPHAFPAVHKLRWKNGFFWWHAMHLHFLIRNAPNYPKLEEWAILHNLDHKNKKSCVAVHVRHGDACMDKYSLHRTCHHWREYADKLAILEKKYGKQDTIFIATDDQKVIEEAIKDKNHKFVFQNISREKYTPKGWGMYVHKNIKISMQR